MPNRVIKESVKRSPQIDALTWFEEVVFYRLIVTADDYGCVDGRTNVLRSDLFPTKDDVTKANLEAAIAKLEAAELLERYEYQGVPYIHLVTWEKHQRMRNQQRKYPEPPLCGQSSATRGQLSADCGSQARNPNPNPNLNPNLEKTLAHSPSGEGGKRKVADFDVFWAAYPKKKSKGDAEKAWKALNPDCELLAIMLDKLAIAKTSPEWTKQGGQFIPHPATWLRGKRWEDEFPDVPARDRTAMDDLRELHGKFAHEEGGL